MQKALYVLKILVEVAKILLPLVKARQITIHTDDDNKDSVGNDTP